MAKATLNSDLKTDVLKTDAPTPSQRLAVHAASFAPASAIREGADGLTVGQASKVLRCDLPASLEARADYMQRMADDMRGVAGAIRDGGYGIGYNTSAGCTLNAEAVARILLSKTFKGQTTL